MIMITTTSILKSIYESKEYKKHRYGVFSVDAFGYRKNDQPFQLRVREDKEVVILKAGDIKEAIDIIKQDIEAENYEQMNDNKTPWAGIRLLIADDKIKKHQKPDTDQGLVPSNRLVKRV
ncbi:hypothetical protein [Desulfotomaculum sp. 1211_IL3151]|uniref:hypothetical protein n=1 Tax=Desulfotomaculum sp. 1211_IL3151 TaxID=3084055 RepID=UPI002FDA45BC